MDGKLQSEQPAHFNADSSDLSDRSLDASSTYLPSILSSVHHRPGYQRVTSAQEEEDTSHKGAAGHHEEDHGADSVHGLRIQFPDQPEEDVTFGATITKKSTPSIPGSADYLLSPDSARSMKRSDTGFSASPETDDQSANGRSSPSSLYRPYTADDDQESLRRGTRSSTLHSMESTGIPSESACTTRKNFHYGRGHWLSVTILVLSVYSTIFSGIWLGLAVAKPRYGKRITDNGSFTPSTASLLSAAFAKTIELSFVTVFVTFLGQVLSQRALLPKSKGITIAEMQMWVWIQQPGTLITHWETVRVAALSYLGGIALTAAFVAMLYTTASDALVTPKLKFGGVEEKLLYGQVRTTFANNSYQVEHCSTPMTNATDPWHYGPTCKAIEHSGQSFHNYAQYLSKWEESGRFDKERVVEDIRPEPVAMLYDNTTIRGSWLDQEDMKTVSDRYDRIVNNVTMAMPLTALFGAVRVPQNDILQPHDLNGLGEYYVQASVPSPSLNVLCAEMTAEELLPMVLVEWPGYNGTAPNVTNYPVGYNIPRRPSWLNKTNVDGLFGFGEKHGRRHPVFPKLPKPYNTVLNTTDLESDSVYLLTTSPNNTHMLCSFRSWMSPNCSTKYNASRSGGSMTTHCNDPNDRLAYHRSQPSAESGVTNFNWTIVANNWALAVSLAAGITDGEAANARLMSQLIPTSRALHPNYPSIAEALAVMASCTILTSATDSPFIHYWNYTEPIADDQPQYQLFNATVHSQDYSSGATKPWQGIFYIVLIIVFLANAFCLLYFIFHNGLLTDFIEPQNLFALSLNSPPSHTLDGCCGGGPEKEQLATSWNIDLDRSRNHFYFYSKDEPNLPNARKRKGKKKVWEMQMDGSPVAEMYDRLSLRRTSTLFG